MYKIIHICLMQIKVKISSHLYLLNISPRVFTAIMLTGPVGAYRPPDKNISIGFTTLSHATPGQRYTFLYHIYFRRVFSVKTLYNCS